MLWYAVKKYGFTGFKKLVRNCIDTAARGVARMNDANINAWRHDNAITIVLPRPSEKICRKWQLAVQDDMAHMVVTPHVTDQVIDRYISDVIAE